MKFTSFWFTNPVDNTSRRVVAAYVDSKLGEVIGRQVSFAVCNTSDTFNKKLGQRIAQNRFEQGFTTHILSNAARTKIINGEQWIPECTMVEAMRRALVYNNLNTAPYQAIQDEAKAYITRELT